MQGCPQFNHVAVVWVPVLLACLFVLCEPQDTSGSGGSSGNTVSPFTEPGVIIGIIVGVVGLLVVLGVSILLCRLFCCKHTSCCTCCKNRDTDELYTLSPNEHKDPSGLGHRPISVISNDHRVNSRSDSANATRSAAHTAQNPPEYYDLPEINWNAKDDQNSGVTNRDSERVSSSKQASPRPHYKEDRRRNRSELGSRAKKRERTDPASGSLRASDADLTGGGETQYRAESDERKFTPMEFTPLEREYRRYKREPESSQDDKVRVGDNERTRTNVTLEHEYRSYNSEPKSWQDNEVRSWDNGRTRIKERREASALSDRSKRSRAHRLLPAGEDNVAFNTESTETTV